MSNIKISALPTSTGTTFNDWVIKNNSGETITEKAQLKDVLGMTSLNGNNAIQSSSWLTQLGTTASTESAIAIGNGAEATSPYAIAIGYKALNHNRDGFRDKYIAIGFEAQSITDGVAIGSDARCLSNGGFAIGNGTRVFGNGGLSLGNLAESYGLEGLAIGKSSRDNTGLTGKNYGIALGTEAVVNEDQSVSIGYQVVDVYSATTHVRNFHSLGQSSEGYYDNLSGSTFTIDWNRGNTQKMTWTSGGGSITCENARPGAHYRMIIDNPSGVSPSSFVVSGKTIKFNGGSFTPFSGESICELFITSDSVFVNQLGLFS
jgi:hypothetical protein